MSSIISLGESMPGQISRQWAEKVAVDPETGFRLKLYNPSESTRYIRDEVNLGMLGGLAIECSVATWDVEDADTLSRDRYGRLVNLAFRERGRLVIMDELVASAGDVGNTELEAQLLARRAKYPLPMMGEYWLLPVSALSVGPLQETIAHKTSTWNAW